MNFQFNLAGDRIVKLHFITAKLFSIFTVVLFQVQTIMKRKKPNLDDYDR